LKSKTECVYVKKPRDNFSTVPKERFTVVNDIRAHLELYQKDFYPISGINALNFEQLNLNFVLDRKATPSNFFLYVIMATVSRQIPGGNSLQFALHAEEILQSIPLKTDTTLANGCLMLGLYFFGIEDAKGFVYSKQAFGLSIDSPDLNNKTIFGPLKGWTQIQCEQLIRDNNKDPAVTSDFNRLASWEDALPNNNVELLSPGDPLLSQFLITIGGKSASLLAMYESDQTIADDPYFRSAIELNIRKLEVLIYRCSLSTTLLSKHLLMWMYTSYATMHLFVDMKVTLSAVNEAYTLFKSLPVESFTVFSLVASERIGEVFLRTPLWRSMEEVANVFYNLVSIFPKAHLVAEKVKQRLRSVGDSLSKFYPPISRRLKKRTLSPDEVSNPPSRNLRHDPSSSVQEHQVQPIIKDNRSILPPVLQNDYGLNVQGGGVLSVRSVLNNESPAVSHLPDNRVKSIPKRTKFTQKRRVTSKTDNQNPILGEEPIDILSPDIIDRGIIAQEMVMQSLHKGYHEKISENSIFPEDLYLQQEQRSSSVPRMYDKVIVIEDYVIPPDKESQDHRVSIPNSKLHYRETYFSHVNTLPPDHNPQPTSKNQLIHSHSTRDLIPSTQDELFSKPRKRSFSQDPLSKTSSHKYTSSNNMDPSHDRFPSSHLHHKIPPQSYMREEDSYSTFSVPDRLPITHSRTKSQDNRMTSVDNVSPEFTVYYYNRPIIPSNMYDQDLENGILGDQDEFHDVFTRLYDQNTFSDLRNDEFVPYYINENDEEYEDLLFTRNPIFLYILFSSFWTNNLSLFFCVFGHFLLPLVHSI